MHPYKAQSAQAIFKIVEDTCIYSLCPNDISKADSIKYVLDIDDEITLSLINKIVNALPDRYFLNGIALLENELKEYIAKEFILFQCQENYRDEVYPFNLMNFIYELTKELQNNVLKLRDV